MKNEPLLEMGTMVCLPPRQTKERRKMKTSGWNHESRSQLEQIMSKGYTMAQAAEMLGKCYQTIRTEIIRGCTDEEYKEKRYTQYKATRATLAELFEDVPEEEIRKVLKELQTEARRL